ncbi:HAD-IIB family hydrolase [Peptostreptococcus faecalis]|uniref:HAD-IIB family hydrolase n=1 Tax=Peptostreptococcus faecalis TaxID=2045015 RepID=UPI001FA85DCD|nr:HAD family hydrolase [Peptostreptococcus faecalis]
MHYSIEIINVKDKKYFFFDIDGTLAVGPQRQIPLSTERTLFKLKERGHFISIATGRMHVMAKDFCEKFGISNMVTDGGNGIVIDGKAEIKPLDKEMMVDIIDEFNYRKIPWSVSLADERIWYTKNEVFPNAMSGIVKIKNYMQTKIEPNLDIRKIEKIYKGFAYLNVDQEKDIEKLKNVTYTRYHKNYIIIEQDDKSIGINRIKEIMGIEDKDIVVFGDNTNDIKMFKPEWTCIAMGNAVNELKDIADFVTKDADDGGIEYACKHFGWID